MGFARFAVPELFGRCRSQAPHHCEHAFKLRLDRAEEPEHKPHVFCPLRPLYLRQGVFVLHHAADFFPGRPSIQTGPFILIRDRKSVV